jgi:hypothetical protein
VSPETIIEKWREIWQLLWDRKARLGADFPELAQIQLRLAGEVVRDLERVFGTPNPSNRRSPVSVRSGL